MKRILFFVMLATLFAAPALGRQWISRDGSFSVEAELLDVKGGNAVLIKQDGSQVTIPLNRLSLGDMRYIRDVLETVEAEITGVGENMPLAAQLGITPVPPTDSPARSFDLEKLRYRWKIGQTYVYRVQLTARSGYHIEELVGEVSYKVQAIQGDQITLTSTSKLVPKHVPFSGVRGGIRRGPLFWSLSRRPIPPKTTITIDSRGRVVGRAGVPLTPLLLGDPTQLMLERLSSEKQASWTIAGDRSIPVSNIQNPNYRHFPAGLQAGLPASEKTIYSVCDETEKLIKLNKRYELKTAAVVGGKPLLEVAGNGKLTFDVDRGVFAGLDLSLHLITRSANITEEIPVQITYRLLSEEEIAETIKKAEEARIKAENARKERKRPLSDDEIESLLADLDSGDEGRISAGTNMFAVKKPRKPNPGVARALEALVFSNQSQSVQSRAIEALKNWATPESVPALIKALSVRKSAVKRAAIETLCRFKPKEAIEPAAKLLSDNMVRRAAAKFLKSIGPDAEDAVLAQLNDNNLRGQATVCDILGVIGTKKSIPVLEQVVLNDTRGAARNARRALIAVKARQAEKEKAEKEGRSGILIEPPGK